MPLNKWMDKQIVAYPYNGVLLRKEKGLDYWYHSTDKNQNSYAEWKLSDKKNTVLFPLCKTL